MSKYESFDLAYQDLIREILENGIEKQNRTGVSTKSVFGANFQVDLSKAFPLLTLKNMSGGVWNSLVHEILWYLSGEHHIKNLKKHTRIWNQWADENDNLSFAYGRFWRRYPLPDLHEQLEGEAWPLGNRVVLQKYVKEETRQTPRGPRNVLVFDQIRYVLDMLENKPFSRRMVLTAHHPANAAVANPPACHCMSVFNVAPDKDGEPEKLSCHLTMRSSDVGLGLPFNVAQYAALTQILAQQAGLEPGLFSYTGVDAHLYIGNDDQEEYNQQEYAERILDREPMSSPTLKIKEKPLDELQFNDFKIEGYEAHSHIGMKCVP